MCIYYQIIPMHVPQSLIYHGANVDKGGNHAPVIMATECGNADGLRMLLQAGANTCVENEGESCKLAKIALRKGFYECLRVLKEYGKIREVDVVNLYPFVKEECEPRANFMVCDILLNQEWDEPMRWASPMTYKALSKADDITLRMIARANIDMNKLFRHENGKNPLQFAASRKPDQEKLVRLLLDLGAEVDAIDNKDQTAAHHAAYKGNVESLSCLCFNGANVSAKNNSSETPAHIIAGNGARSGNFRTVDCMNVLLKWGADFGIKDKYGSTPTHIAIRTRNIDCLRFLFKHCKGNLSKRDNDEKFPGDYQNYCILTAERKYEFPDGGEDDLPIYAALIGCTEKEAKDQKSSKTGPV